MVATFRKAEYKTQRDTAPYQVERADWYRCSEGFTIGNHMCPEGDVHHISELDVDGPDPDNAGMTVKIESFQPLSLPEQERRFGRIMYMPYKPTDEELQLLGWERSEVTADEAASQEQLYETHGEDFMREIEQMPESRLRKEAEFRFGVSFSPGSSPEKMRDTLRKLYEGGDEALKDHVTEQMMANAAQRVPTKVSVEAVSDTHDAIEERREEESAEQRTARRKAKAADKLKQAGVAEETK